MKTYIGTKIVKATPMNRGAYHLYRGWTLPADENGLDPGYLVEYMDGGQPSHIKHKGYISWSPAEQFDGAYVPCGDLDALLPHQVRLVAEKTQLDERIRRLGLFLDANAANLVGQAEADRMHRQLALMEKYSEILWDRLQSTQTKETP